MRNALERQVFGVVKASQPVTEAAITDALMAQGGAAHPEILGAALRRLIGAGYIARNDNAYSALTNTEADKTAAAAHIPALSAKQEKTVPIAKTRACSSCGKPKPIAEFYTGQAKCKPCYNQAQKDSKARRAGKAGGGPTVTGKARTKQSGAVMSVPLKFEGGPLVSRQFTLSVSDVSGKVHNITVGQETVQRLATELREFA